MCGRHRDDTRLAQNEAEYLARAERYADHIAETNMHVVRQPVREGAIETGGFELCKNLDDADQRNSAVPGAVVNRAIERRNVARGIVKPASTSPIACGKANRVSLGIFSRTASASMR